jgi:hypothetical protein
MLTVDLREDFARIGSYVKYSAAIAFSSELPAVVVSRAKIERERNCRAIIPLDVPPKIDAVLRVETALIAATGVLIQNVCEA